MKKLLVVESPSSSCAVQVNWVPGIASLGAPLISKERESRLRSLGKSGERL